MGPAIESLGTEALFLFIIDNDHKILGDGGNSVTDAVSDFEPLRVRIGIPITIGSASACAGSYSYCCHKRLSFVTVEMQLLQGDGLGRWYLS
nr:MAG TPA: hypothetical protein [Caudoviricetes sp.]